TRFYHVRVEGIEDLGELLESGGQGSSFFNVLSYLAKHVFKEYVFLLLSEDVDTLHERQTSIDHHRELTCKDGQFTRSYFLPTADLRDRDVAAFFGSLRQDDLFSPQQVPQFIVAAGFFFTRNQFVQTISSFVS